MLIEADSAVSHSFCAGALTRLPACADICPGYRTADDFNQSVQQRCVIRSDTRLLIEWDRSSSRSLPTSGGAQPCSCRRELHVRGRCADEGQTAEELGVRRALLATKQRYSIHDHQLSLELTLDFHSMWVQQETFRGENYIRRLQSSSWQLGTELVVRSGKACVQH
ncbi:hypothetical protein AOLI_G00131690 [Acnodon oligacanthus]